MNDDQDRFDAWVCRMVENIRRTGRTLVGVFPDAASTDPLNDAFVYSIGNSLVDLPELLIVGMCDGSYPINRLSEIMIARGRKFDDGEVVSLGEGAVPVCVVDAVEEVKERYTFQATQFLDGNDNYQVMQVVIPDKDGRFPWQAECAPPYRNVKVYRRARLN